MTRMETEAQRAHRRKRLRKRYKTDPEYRERVCAYARAYRKRHANDPAYRRRRNRATLRWLMSAYGVRAKGKYRTAARNRYRERCLTDPKYRAKLSTAQRERYRTDPEYRERVCGYVRAYYQRKRLDPNYRRQRNEANGRYARGRARQKRAARNRVLAKELARATAAVDAVIARTNKFIRRQNEQRRR